MKRFGIVALGMSVACTGETVDEMAQTADTAETGCDPSTCPDTGEMMEERNLFQYAIALNFVAVDENGNAVPIVVEDENGPVDTPSWRMLWVNDLMNATQLCTTTYSATSTPFHGGPFTLEGLSTQTWNVWEWTLSVADDNCDGIATPADRVRMAEVGPGKTVYVAAAPFEGEVPDNVPFETVAATWAWWSNVGDPDATNPNEGGRFIESGWSTAVYEWDGSDPFDLAKGTLREDLDKLKPGVQALRNAVIEYDVSRTVGLLD
ncbi:MAG: hypothetical protein AAGA48_18905 [Myxococcota bacterium]